MDLPIIDQATADAYFALTARDAAWMALDPTAKDVALNEAQVWLSQLCWDTSVDCCGNDFSLSWERAVSELALALHTNPTALIPAGAAATGALGPIKRQKLDALEVEYFDPRGTGASSGATDGKYGPKAPLVLRVFPWLGEILGCWLNVPTGNSRLVYRVRS